MAVVTRHIPDKYSDEIEFPKILELGKDIFAKTIASDLVPVIPMKEPSVLILPFIDLIQ